MKDRRMVEARVQKAWLRLFETVCGRSALERIVERHASRKVNKQAVVRGARCATRLRLKPDPEVISITSLLKFETNQSELIFKCNKSRKTSVMLTPITSRTMPVNDLKVDARWHRVADKLPPPGRWV